MDNYMYRITYTATPNFPADGTRSGIYIKQQDNAALQGDRRTVGVGQTLADSAMNPWTVVYQADGIGQARNDQNNNCWGIFTPGQMSCMCIIITIFETEASRTWSQAWLVHVSSIQHPAINQMIAKLDATNYRRAHVAIGGKTGVLGSMDKIREAFAGTEIVNDRSVRDGIPSTYPAHVFPPLTCLVYAGGNDNETFGFGLNKDGFVGEATGLVAKKQ